MQRLTLQPIVCSQWMRAGCDNGSITPFFWVGLARRIATACLGLPDSPEDFSSAQQLSYWCAVHALPVSCRSMMPVRSFACVSQLVYDAHGSGVRQGTCPTPGRR